MLACGVHLPDTAPSVAAMMPKLQFVGRKGIGDHPDRCTMVSNPIIGRENRGGITQKVLETAYHRLLAEQSIVVIASG